MAWFPYFADLPTTGSPPKHYVDEASWDALVDNFVTWKGNVNGGGFTLSNVNFSGASVSGSATLNFPSIPRGESKVLSFAAVGVVAGSVVHVGPPAAWDDEVSFSARASATDTIKVIVVNNRADGFEYDPPSGTWTWEASVPASPSTLSGSATLSFPTIPSGEYRDLTITVAGAVAGRPISWGAPPGLEDGLSVSCWISAANTVTVRCKNDEITGAPVTPAPGVYTLFLP